jgi:hypothetical protein
MSRDGSLRTLLRTHLPDSWHVQAIETGGVGAGVPDLNVCIPGVGEVWIELKHTETRNAGLRPHQVSWISRRARAGGRVWIAVRYQHDGGPRRGDPCDELWLISGAQVLQLHRDGLSTELAWLVTQGGPRRWDWGRLTSILVSGSPCTLSSL